MLALINLRVLRYVRVCVYRCVCEDVYVHMCVGECVRACACIQQVMNTWKRLILFTTLFYIQYIYITYMFIVHFIAVESGK